MRSGHYITAIFFVVLAFAKDYALTAAFGAPTAGCCPFGPFPVEERPQTPQPCSALGEENAPEAAPLLRSGHGLVRELRGELALEVLQCNKQQDRFALPALWQALDEGIPMEIGTERAEKDKPLGNGDGGLQPSPPTPFQAAPGQAGYQPWFPTEVSPFAVAMREQSSSSNQTIAANSELAASLRKAFAGQEDKIPAEVRETMERLEKENGKAVIRSMHTTTNALSKAKKSLAEIVDAKKAHRTQWMSHLTESIGQWEAQLMDYRKQQAFFQEQATRATAEISQARRMMDQLGAKAAGETPKPTKEEPEEIVAEIIPDQEEEKLRKDLTDKLAACACALGIEVKPLPVLVDDDGDSMEDLANKKRAAVGVDGATAYDCSVVSDGCAAGIPLYQQDGIPEYVLGRHLKVCRNGNYVDPLSAIRNAQALRWELLRDGALLGPHPGDVRGAPRECRLPEPRGPPEAPAADGDAPVRGDLLLHGPDRDAAREHWDGINHALTALFLEHGAVEQEEEGMVFYMKTLCIADPVRRISDEVRAVRLTADVPRWRRMIEEAWNDVLQPEQVWDLHLVRPQPVVHVGVPAIPFLVLHQNLPPTEIALVATIVADVDDEALSALQYRAAAVPGLANQADIVRHVALDDLCQRYRCNVQSGEVEFNEIPYLLHHGFGVVIDVLQPDGPPTDDQASSAEESNDHDSEMASNSDEPDDQEFAEDGDADEQGNRDDAQSNHVTPGDRDELAPGDRDQEWLAVIYQLDRPTRRLLLKMQTYEIMITDISRKLRIPIQDIVAVHEIGTPLVGVEDTVNNLILQLDGDIPPGNSGRLIIIDYEQHQVDARWTAPASHRSVYLVNEWMSRHHFLEILGVAEYCQEQRSRCLVTLNGRLWPLQDRRVLQQQHGNYGRVIVPPPRRGRVPTAEAIDACRARHGVQGQFPLPPETDMEGYMPTDPESAGGELVGTGSVPHARCLDMSPIFRCFEILDTHMFLPQYDLPLGLALSDDSRQWIADWWEPGAIVQEIAIYYDGSYQASDDTAGIGIAAWVSVADKWQFAGALSSGLPGPSSAYLAEQAASLVAAKFGYDLVKLCTLGGSTPDLCFHFDNMVVGQQLLGHWKAIQSQTTCHAVRDLMYLLTARFELQPRGRHIYSHQGEPGNELVDALADLARRGTETHDLRAFLRDFVSKEHVASLDWVWALFDKDYPINWTTQQFELPHVRSQPDPEVLPLDVSPQADLDLLTWHVELTLCTFNVLSLKSADPALDGEGYSNVTGPVKQELLFEQMAQDRFKIFALQETRLRKLHWKHDSRFFLFRSAATSRGHGGLLIGFNRGLPYATCAQTGRAHYFREHHFTIAPKKDLDRFTLKPVSSPAWHVDVSTHAAYLNAQLELQLAACPAAPKARPKKPGLTDATWALIQEKKGARHTRDSLRKLSRCGLLQATFAAWSASRTAVGGLSPSERAAFDAQTRKGTRPGSPLADAIWHLLMHDALTDIEDWLMHHHPHAELLQRLPIDCSCSVIWADDVAIPLLAGDAPTLLSSMRQLCTFLHGEELMVHAHSFHKLIFRTLTAGGCEFEPKLEAVEQIGQIRTDSHSCACGKSFSTAQGLACHKRIVHGCRAPEAPFLQNATCPSCLKFLWTTNRLRSHLSYIPRDGSPNQCYTRLVQLGYEVDYIATDFPADHRGHHRCDALQAYGPMLDPTPLAEKQVQQLQTAAAALRQDLAAVFAHRAEDDGQHLGEALTTLTMSWYRAFQRSDRRIEAVRDVADSWLELLTAYDDGDASWASAVFLCWGREWLPALVDTFEDGFAETYVTDEFYQLCSGLPHFHLETQLEQLERRIRALESQPEPQPHRPVYLGPANASERLRASSVVPRLLREQELWQSQLRKVRWDGAPDARLLPLVYLDEGPPAFIFVHLFSGRRRPGDIHWHLQRMAADAGLRLAILSLDTAIAPTLGDLTSTSSTWGHLRNLYDYGWCAATMLGSPCLYTAAAAAVHGGLWLSEHPAVPRNPDHVSTWRAAVTELIRGHPEIKLHTVMQWVWGATVPKPTGLLALRLPKLMTHMYQCATPGATFPANVAIGRDPTSGHFRTSEHKEYPDDFCKAISHAFIARLKEAVQHGQTRSCHMTAGNPMYRWLLEVIQTSQQIHTAATWLPDFQDVHSGRKKAEESGATAESSNKARPAPPKETYSAYPRGMGAPLPGGMPLVKSFASQKRTAAAKKSDDAVPGALNGGGLLSWMDQAKQIFSDRSAARCLGSLPRRSCCAPAAGNAAAAYRGHLPGAPGAMPHRDTFGFSDLHLDCGLQCFLAIAKASYRSEMAKQFAQHLEHLRGFVAESLGGEAQQLRWGPAGRPWRLGHGGWAMAAGPWLGPRPWLGQAMAGYAWLWGMTSHCEW
eukprot:Skav235191  [mRNA]  locus=scaffold1938:49274:69407:+ [translate_table: standard]